MIGHKKNLTEGIERQPHESGLGPGRLLVQIPAQSQSNPDYLMVLEVIWPDSPVM